MAALKRLITYVDVAEAAPERDQVSAALRHEVEPTDRHRVLLLNHRDWNSTGTWKEVSRQDCEETSASDPDQVSVALRHEVELTDGQRVLLLNDRGWNSTGSWKEISRQNIEETSLMCVRPDAPLGNYTEQDMEAMHWAQLEQNARKQGVHIDVAELASLPHDIVLSERLLARIDDDSSARTDR